MKYANLCHCIDEHDIWQTGHGKTYFLGDRQIGKTTNIVKYCINSAFNKKVLIICYANMNKTDIETKLLGFSNNATVMSIKSNSELNGINFSNYDTVIVDDIDVYNSELMKAVYEKVKTFKGEFYTFASSISFDELTCNYPDMFDEVCLLTRR